MSVEQIVRAWTDISYRNSLSKEELAQLPENPVGMIELSDIVLENVSGGSCGSDWSGCATCGPTCSGGVCSGYCCTQPCFCASCSFISCC